MALGLEMGNQWGYYQNNKLKDHIATQDAEIKRLSETVALYEKGKSDLTSLVNKIADEKLLYVTSSAEGSVTGATVLTKEISFGEAFSYRGIIYFSFADFQTEEEYKNVDSTIRYAKGKIDFSVGTYKTEATHFMLQVGDSVRFILDGSTYVILLKKIWLAGFIPGNFPESLKLSVEIMKVS